MAFAVGETLRKHYNNDTLYNAATKFIEANHQLAKDHLSVGHNHLSKTLLDVLYPLNSSEANKGLNIDNIRPIIEAYRGRLNGRIKIVGELLGSTAALVTFAASMAIGIFGMIIFLSNSPTSIVLGYAFCAAVAMIGFSTAVGFGVSRLVNSHFPTNYNWKFSEMEEAIRAKNGADFISYKSDIATLLYAVDSTAKSALISKMNFSQMHAACKCLGEATFLDSIKEVKSEEAVLWRDVLWIKNSNPTPQQLQKMLHERSSIINERHEVWAELHHFFADKPEHLKVLYDSFSKITSEPVEGTIKIRSGEMSKEYDAQILLSKSEFLNARRRVEGFVKDLVMPDETDENIFRYFDFLAGNFTIQSKQDVLELLPYAHYFSDTKTRDMIGAILMLYESELSDEEHEEIVSEFYPSDTRYYEFHRKRNNKLL
jgi:hypothetical protein